MSASATRFTAAEYLALEAASETKHELVNGIIVAMAGGSPAHNALCANMIIALGGMVRNQGCLVLTSDQRVLVPATGLYTYPDVTVACGEREYDDGTPKSLLNPTCLVEVTSKTTEDFDRGSKFVHYQSIASLREYVVVSHRERRVDVYRRTDAGQWLITTYAADAAVIELLYGNTPLSEIYSNIDLAEGG